MEKGYITIPEWMLHIGLTGNELLVFAVIYGFSQDGESEYRGGYNWISGFLGLSRNTARNTIASLVNKGFIIKRAENINGVSFNRYSVCSEIGRGCQELAGGMPKIGTNNTKGNIKNSITSLSHSEDKSSSFDNSVIEERRPKDGWIDLILEKFPAVATDFRAIDAIGGWIESRKKTNKKPPTNRAIELAVKRAVNFSEETPQHSVADYFDNATLNGWQGIFQFKEEDTSNKGVKKNGKSTPDAIPGYQIEEEVL